MDNNILFQTDLDLSTQFFTKEERNAYIIKICRSFQKALQQEFSPIVLSEKNRERICRFFRVFAKISASIYNPVTVKYNLYEDIMWFSLKSDYISVDLKTIPEWQMLLNTSPLEINLSNDDGFLAEAALTDIFN